MEHGAVTPFLFDLIILNMLRERGVQKGRLDRFTTEKGKKQEGEK